MARRLALRRALSTLVTVPVTIVLVTFAVSNRQEVFLSLWPLSEGVAIPLYLLVLALFLLGALAGATAAWLTGGKTRRLLREAARRADRAEREARELRERAVSGETAAAGRRLAAAPDRRSVLPTS